MSEETVQEETKPADLPDPVKAKQQELLSETKAAKARARELEAKLAEYEAKEAEKQEQEAIKRGEFEKVTATLREEANTYKARLEAEIVGSSLTKALLDANVAAPFMEAAKALLKSQGAGIDKEGKAIIGGRPLAEVVAEFAESEQGKHFIAAPSSSGGGASGGGAANPVQGNLGGTREEREAAIAARFKLPTT